jgi:hypothetical protein
MIYASIAVGSMKRIIAAYRTASARPRTLRGVADDQLSAVCKVHIGARSSANCSAFLTWAGPLLQVCLVQSGESSQRAGFAADT